MTLLPLLPRAWVVVALLFSLALGGACWVIGDQASASLQREYEINGYYREYLSVCIERDSIGVYARWLQYENRDLRIRLARHGLARHGLEPRTPPPF